MSEDQVSGLFGVFAVLFSGTLLFVCLALVVLMIAAMWIVFQKAGKPGWAAIVPIYNAIVLLEIVGRPIWWIALFLIPLANIVIAIIVHIDVAKSFGRSPAFGVGLALLGWVFYPILAFGDARYQGPSAGNGGSAPAPLATA